MRFVLFGFSVTIVKVLLGGVLVVLFSREDVSLINTVVNCAVRKSLPVGDP